MGIFPDGEIVVGFQNLLPAVIQLAIAVEYVFATGFEEPLVGTRRAAEHAAEAESIAGAMPQFAFDA